MLKFLRARKELLANEGSEYFVEGSPEWRCFQLALLYLLLIVLFTGTILLSLFCIDFDIFN